jgi:hypothetical protein
MMETCDLRIYVLRVGVSQMRLSHVVTVQNKFLFDPKDMHVFINL